jgi:hypothetical protein
MCSNIFDYEHCLIREIDGVHVSLDFEYNIWAKNKRDPLIFVTVK